MQWDMVSNNFILAAQCVGRVIRCKTDYGIMVFADKVLLFIKEVFKKW